MVTLLDQLDQLKRSVSYDVYDISVRQLVDMVQTGVIDVSPDYQRHFVWEDERESELIESILLGIPVPSLYMATNPDSSWEVVDGVQRLSTLVHFCGSDAQVRGVGRKDSLRLKGLSKLTQFNNLRFDDLPVSTQTYLTLRPIRITTLNDRSDVYVRYDLFERLNTGGVKLHPQEIRNCVMSGTLRDAIKRLAVDADFRAVVRLPKNEVEMASYEEMVLRFFAFYDRYLDFDHDVGDFLTSYMQENAKTGPSAALEKLFGTTMFSLRQHLPQGISRNGRRQTPVNLYEGVAVGTALALKQKPNLNWAHLPGLLESVQMKKFSTGATNSRPMVRGRIELVRDTLLG